MPKDESEMNQAFQKRGHKRAMRKLCHIIHLFYLTFLFVAGCSYTKDLTVLTRKQAVGDLDYLVKNVKAIHPDPFTYVSEEEFDTHSEQIKAGLGDTISRKDFSLYTAELLALIKDDHTRYQYWFSPDFAQYVHSGGKIFPLVFRFNDGHMVIDTWATNFEPKNLKKGNVVISINGTSMESLLKQYGRYISAETDLQKNWSLEKWMHYFLWLTEGEQDSFELKLTNSEGNAYAEKIPTIKYPFDENTKKDEREELLPFSFHVENKVCILKIKSFEANWEAFTGPLNNLFAEMIKTDASVLIIDLRGNGGGTADLPAELIRRIAKKPYKEYSKKWRYSKAYQKAWLIAGLKQRNIPAWLHLENVIDLRKYKWEPDPSQLQGEYFITQHRITDSTAMYNNRWIGNTVILVDRYTGSAAVWMAAIIKDNELGIVAGEETGGRASFFGDIAPILLPNSGLSCVIASSYLERPAGYNDGHGVLPDLPLDVTQEDCVLVEKIYNHIRDNGN